MNDFVFSSSCLQSKSLVVSGIGAVAIHAVVPHGRRELDSLRLPTKFRFLASFFEEECPPKTGEAWILPTQSFQDPAVLFCQGRCSLTSQASPKRKTSQLINRHGYRMDFKILRLRSTIRLSRMTGQNVMYDTLYHWSVPITIHRIRPSRTTESGSGSGSQPSSVR